MTANVKQEQLIEQNTEHLSDHSGCVKHTKYIHGIYCVMAMCSSVWLGAEGPRDAKSCRGTSVATSSSTRPIAIGAMVGQPGGQRIGFALLF